MLRRIVVGVCCWACLWAVAAQADDTLPPVSKRFADGATDEVPNFQKHVAPLFGRLGCNGRACHGSFQGRGGFQLSLFGYELDADYNALLDKESPRIDVEDPAESLILIKPTDEDMHEGGKRYDKDGWQYHVFRKWIEAGAPHEKGHLVPLKNLTVEPAEIQFAKAGESVQLRVIAVWDDGTREDVTPLCRFKSNDTQIATIDADGVVTGGETGDTHVVVFYDKAVVPIPVMRPVSRFTGERYPQVETPTKIDELVVARLKKLGIVPSPVADDVTFLRRVSLDLTGTLPTADEVRAFLADASPDKRAAKIEELMESPAYAAWWTTRLCDWTGNSEQQLNNVTPNRRASQDWYDWIYDRVARNVPYDDIVEGIVLGTSREPGESYREFCANMTEIYKSGSKMSFASRSTMPYYWARRNFRTPDDRVIGFAYSFLGIRIQCAQCHKHPFDQWSKQDFAQFRGFFTSTVFSNRGKDRKEYEKLLAELKIDEKTKKNGGQLRRALTQRLRDGEVVPFPEVYVDSRRIPRSRAVNAKNRNRRPSPGATAKLLGDEVVDLSKYEDPREALMDWLRRPENPYFARALVNRVWAVYFGRGIVEPSDDLNLANPPTNAPLLDYLATEFIRHDYDLKWLHRTICNSATYQRDWRPNETNILDHKHFSRAVPRRMDAEQVYDAVLAATAANERARKMREDLTGRAVALPGPGRTGRANSISYTLSLFGRSTRESNCDCDRSSDPNLLQTVFLQNDNDVLTRIRNGGWVAEVTGRPIGPNRVSAAARKQQQLKLQRAKTLQKRLAQVQAQLKQLRNSKAQNKQQLAKRLQSQATQLRKALAKARQGLPGRSESEGGAPKKSWNVAKAVEDAYLRTLSRLPSSDERAAAIDFINESESPDKGLEGVLWALINTKEFIVNH